MSLGCLFLLVLSSLSAADKTPGFTGKFREELLGAAPGIELRTLDKNEAEDQVSSRVKALAVGAKKITPPSNPYTPHFTYYAYNLLTMDEWWMGIIVVNYSSVDETVNLQIKVRRSSTYIYEKEVTVPAYTAMLYSAEYEMPPGIGMYHLTGLVSGPTVVANRVHSKLYIYDSL